MEIGDLVRVRTPSRPIGIITKITILRGKAYLEVDVGDHVYRRYPSSLEVINESR